MTPRLPLKPRAVPFLVCLLLEFRALPGTGEGQLQGPSEESLLKRISFWVLYIKEIAIDSLALHSKQAGEVYSPCLYPPPSFSLSLALSQMIRNKMGEKSPGSPCCEVVAALEPLSERTLALGSHHYSN